MGDVVLSGSAVFGFSFPGTVDMSTASGIFGCGGDEAVCLLCGAVFDSRDLFASSSALSVHSVHSVRSQSSRTSRHSKQRRATTDVVDVDATHEAKEETWEVDEAAIETARTDVFREVAKGKNELDEEEKHESIESIGLEASDVKQM